MRTDSLYRYADLANIALHYADLPECKAFSMQNGNRCVVALHRKTTAAEERVFLAHELGHCETLSFYDLEAPLTVREKCERKADRWAIAHLVPKRDYLAALRAGYTELWRLADYFEVTPEFMEKAVEYYRTA